MTEKNKITEHTGETGNTSKTELGQVLSKTPLTVEQQVVQLRNEVQNVNKGIFELFDLFKEVLKKQTNTEDMIEKNVAATAIVTKEIKETMSNIKTEIKETMSNIKMEVNEKMNNIKTEVNEKIDNTKKEIKEKIDFTDRNINNTTNAIKSKVDKIKEDTYSIRYH